MGQASKVAVVLVNWNSREDLLECLEAVFRLDYSNFFVVVVDNQSSDDSLGFLRSWLVGDVSVRPESNNFDNLFSSKLDREKIKFEVVDAPPDFSGDESYEPKSLFFVSAGTNSGYASGNNIGIRFACRDAEVSFYWLLNVDTVVSPASLAHLVSRAIHADRPGMTGSTLLYYHRPEIIQALGGGSLDERSMRTKHIGIGEFFSPISQRNSREVESSMAYVVGASMLVSREFVVTVGPMQEDYFLYFEEIDWAMRGKNKFTLGFASDSIVYHKVGGASAKIMSLFSMRLLQRNRLRFVARFYRPRFFSALVVCLFDALKLFLRFRFQESFVLFGVAVRSPRVLREVDVGKG